MAFLVWFGLKILLSLLTQLASSSSSSCDNQPCNIINHCAGMLICINGNCNDDPVVNINMCTQGSLPSPNDDASSCQASGTLNCSGKFYPQYRCSPPVTSFTKAILTTNDFSEGGDGGYASECDNKFHDNSELVVALSTGWYDGGSRCGKMIRITSRNGTRSVTAKVVDECDSVYGCDEEHGGWPPCVNNNINGNKAVWDALGLNMDMGEERVTWSMA